MAWTIDQYNALQNAIGQGATEVWYGDKKVIYRSLSEMLQILNMMRSELGINQCDTGRSIGIYDKGVF